MQIQQMIFPLRWALNAMETISSYGGRIDQSVYSFPPTYSNYLKMIF
jgi:hypothetical protein